MKTKGGLILNLKGLLVFVSLIFASIFCNSCATPIPIAYTPKSIPREQALAKLKEFVGTDLAIFLMGVTESGIVVNSLTGTTMFATQPVREIKYRDIGDVKPTNWNPTLKAIIIYDKNGNKIAHLLISIGPTPSPNVSPEQYALDQAQIIADCLMSLRGD